MRAVRINPQMREIALVEGDIEELVEEQVGFPQGYVACGENLGLIVCPLGPLGPGAALFWHHTIADFFGGICFLIAVDGAGKTVSVPEQAWSATRRAVEFLGAAPDALPRLQSLVFHQIGFDAAEPSQLNLKLH